MTDQTTPRCACKDRPATECPGEWEPGCDLGANPAHVRVATATAKCGTCAGTGEDFNEGDPCHVCGGSGNVPLPA